MIGGQAFGIFLAVAVILLATLYPGGGPLPRGWSVSFATSPAPGADIVQNLLLFIPLGAALALARVRLLPTIVLGAALSFLVEFIQQWIPGRDPSVGDIVCNTLGTAIGAGLVRTAPRWLSVSPRRAAWQALALALTAATVWLATAGTIGSGHTIGNGWRLIFFPERLPGWTHQLTDALWLGGWLLCVGYWGGRAGRHPAVYAAASVAIAALALVPALAGLQTTTVGEWMGALVGMVGGYLVSGRYRVLQDRLGDYTRP